MLLGEAVLVQVELSDGFFFFFSGQSRVCSRKRHARASAPKRPRGPISPSTDWTTTPGRFIGADTPAHRAAGRIGVPCQNRKEKRKTNSS
jgi:hypothetical protein